MNKNAVPNIFTLSNLAFGVLSLIMTFQADYKMASLFILIAGLIDRYDGRVARFLDVSSEIGKELDSLADLVSFGVAPSILVFNLYSFSELGLLGYLLLLIFPMSGAYRLARYNITSFDGLFTGVPITAAGSFLALYSLLTIDRVVQPILPIILVVMFSYLMISKLRFKKV
ncbi:CDP-diacylglycerol--serine O-phosphatidyltransferase [Clostridium sp. HMP27]|uniref:CDP-diacylglycerol--serine O-phosphatidyltransferase n=1 Tax=Clostridium sp. HMP27 TaxID=1487921 RepID=UPI00052DFD8C|nr:CDP-diacylglycerol--serine O-phosphatidyltransferase [Clostridium sp. HMP27]KGK90743.1 CDP-diacylglycerol--serine O-phosphatidyltransferase [Clostridium sp. HMP27]